MITLDTSAILSLADREDPNHHRTRTALIGEHGARLVPVEVLAEVAYMIARELGRSHVVRLLEGLAAGTVDLDSDTAGRLPRIIQLYARYSELDLDFCDAAVVACAEANGGRVLTLDRRDFDVIAGEGRITVLP